MIEVGDSLQNVNMPARIDGKFQHVNPVTEYFSGKRVIIFGLPGAFTPTCSTYQLPGFDEKFDQFKEKGIDEIYCVSVNDSFVMDAWFKDLDVKNVKPLADGNGTFTRSIGALVPKDNLGFGHRSWRYSMVVNDGVVEQVFAEEGFGANIESDPYVISSPENVLANL